MSYCHLDGSTPKVLQLHPLVRTQINNRMSSASCYSQCEDYVPPECAMTDISTSTQLACDPLTSTYTQQLVVTYENAPAGGWLSSTTNHSSSDPVRKPSPWLDNRQTAKQWT